MEQLFAVRQLCEIFGAMGKVLLCAYMDLEKAYDRMDRDALWQVL